MLILASLIAVAAILAVIPWRLSRGHHPERSSPVTALTLLWAVVSVAVTAIAALRQMQWQAEYQRLLYSNYYDPRNAARDRPQLAWFFLAWGVLALAYVVLILAAVYPRRGRGKMQ